MIITNTQKCTINLPAGGPLLRPGDNEVDASYWASVTGNPAVKMYLEVGHLKAPNSTKATKASNA